LGEMGSQSYYLAQKEEEVTVGRQRGINTLRSGSATVTFESLKPPGCIPGPPRTGDFSRLSWEQPKTSGKNSEVLGKVFSRLR
jgi:hypothetical protein